MSGPLASLAWLPGPIKAPFRRLRDTVDALRYRGNERLCPVCGKTSRRFRPFGPERRDDAQCVHCLALERHRFLWIFLSEHTDLFDGRSRRMLHVAPEPHLAPRLRARLGEGYVTADLTDRHVCAQVDVTAIPFREGSFDVVYAGHVLEHVVADRQAMREFRRVLKPDGWGILNVPIMAPRTIEDPALVDPAERLRLYGQADHVRLYGPDFTDRLVEAGFTVRLVRVADVCGPADAERYGLTQGSGEIHLCSRESRRPLTVFVRGAHH